MHAARQSRPHCHTELDGAAGQRAKDLAMMTVCLSVERRQALPIARQQSVRRHRSAHALPRHPNSTAPDRQGWQVARDEAMLVVERGRLRLQRRGTGYWMLAAP